MVLIRMNDIRPKALRGGPQLWDLPQITAQPVRKLAPRKMRHGDVRNPSFFKLLRQIRRPRASHQRFDGVWKGAHKFQQTLASSEKPTGRAEKENTH